MFYIGESLKIVFNTVDSHSNPIDLTGYEKIVSISINNKDNVRLSSKRNPQQYFPPIEDLSQSSFQIALSGEDTEALGTGTMRVLVEMSKDGETRIATACVIELADPFSVCNEDLVADNDDKTINLNLTQDEIIFNIRTNAGVPGSSGWTSSYEFISVDVDRVVQRLVDYFGGTGTKPIENIGKYVSEGGFADNIDDALNFKGERGREGKSAYTIAVEHGFIGTEEEWIASLSSASEEAADDARSAAGYAIQATTEANDATNAAVLATANADHAASDARAATINVNNAISEANTATNAANTAAMNANSATTDAANAGQAATEAANKAIEATGKAEEAANNTIQAISDAENAATAANAAKDAANTAAENANSAATNANAKATLANDAATLANSKAALANDAAALANAKAELANTAAENANEAATNANNAALAASNKIAELETYEDRLHELENNWTNNW